MKVSMKMEIYKVNSELSNSEKYHSFDEIDVLLSIVKWINEKHRFIRDLVIFMVAYRLGIKGFCWLLEIAPSIITSMEENGISCIGFLNALFKIYIGIITVFKLCLVCNIFKFIITKTIQFFKSSDE